MCRVNLTLFVCVYVIVIVSAGVIDNSLYRLDIVHYNDFHDSFEETTVQFPQCKTNDSRCIGGFSRLYHAVMTLMKSKPNPLLLNAGDVFQGTYWYTLLKWNITQKFINLLPNDAHALGNHEFDDRIPGLVPYLAALKSPMLVANVDISKEPSFEGLILPHIVLERNGRKIGIIGVTTPSIKLSAKAGNIIFLDPIPVVEKESALLTTQGVDVIIVLSHCGLPCDKKIADAVGDNIDIIVGGHSHSLLWNTEAPTKEAVDGPYPIVVESHSKPGHKVLIVTASAYTKYLGNISMWFDSQGELVTFEGEPVFLNRSIPEDPEITALIHENLKELPGVNEVVGYTEENLLIDSCQARECAIGNLFADAFLNATKETVPYDLPNVAFLLKNMIRGSLEKGNITRGGLINSSSFLYKVVTFILRGRHLVDAMEHCLSLYFKLNPFRGPWIPQVAGMQVTLNTTSRKVESIMIRDGDKIEPLDLDKDYQVTTLSYLMKGGNGFKMLKEHGHDAHYIGVDTELMEKYIRKVSPIKITLDHRLILVS